MTKQAESCGAVNFELRTNSIHPSMRSFLCFSWRREAAAKETNNKFLGINDQSLTPRRLSNKSYTLKIVVLSYLILRISRKELLSWRRIVIRIGTALEVCDAHRIRLQNMFSPSHGQSCRTSLPQSPELSNDYFDLLGPGDPQNEPFFLLKHFNVEELVATTFFQFLMGLQIFRKLK